MSLSTAVFGSASRAYDVSSFLAILTGMDRFKPKGKIDQNEVLGFDSSAGQSKDSRDDDELRVMF